MFFIFRGFYGCRYDIRVVIGVVSDGSFRDMFGGVRVWISFGGGLGVL